MLTLVTSFTLIAALFASFMGLRAAKKTRKPLSLMCGFISLYFSVAYALVLLGYADSVTIGAVYLRPMIGLLFVLLGLSEMSDEVEALRRKAELAHLIQKINELEKEKFTLTEQCDMLERERQSLIEQLEANQNGDD